MPLTTTPAPVPGSTALPAGHRARKRARLALAGNPTVLHRSYLAFWNRCQ